MLSYLKTLAFILFMLAVGFTWRYEYWLLYHISFGVLFVLALFIAFTFVVGFYLKDSANPTLAALGQTYEKLFQYTALAQGVFYTTLVFFILGTTVNREIPIPDFDKKFTFDWIYGSNYATLLIYGALLCMLWFFQRLSLAGYALTLIIAMGGLGVPILFFMAETRLRDFHAQYADSFSYGFILIQLALSATGMQAVKIVGISKNKTKQKRLK